jgi:hypothetical protein
MLRLAHRARSALDRQTLKPALRSTRSLRRRRFGVVAPTAVPPASSTVDSSLDPSSPWIPLRHGSITGLSHQRRAGRSPSIL